MAHLDLNSYTVNVKWLPTTYTQSDSLIITISRLQVKVYPKQPYSVRYTFNPQTTPKEELVVNRPYLIDVLGDNSIYNYVTISKANTVKVNYNKIINDTKNKISSMFDNGYEIIEQLSKSINVEKKSTV